MQKSKINATNYYCLNDVIHFIKTKTALFATYFLAVTGICLLIAGFFSKRELFTGAAAIFAAAALAYTAYSFNKSTVVENSKFYLEQVKLYFQDAAKFIATSGNNAIKWHQAIRLLQTTVDLLPKITETAHKDIYFTDYLSTAYEIVNILATIDSPDFFRGEQNLNYGSKIPINKKSLKYLICFLYKASQITYDNEGNGKSFAECISSDYFCEPITESYYKKHYGSIKSMVSGSASLMTYIDSEN
jgi:hypothetical protein